MATLHSDIYITGNEMSGLVAGALLARRGLRVTLLDMEPAPDTRMFGDHMAPSFPTILNNISCGPALSVVEELEIRSEIKGRFLSGAPIGFILDPLERAILSPIKQELRFELIRIFKNQAKEILAQLDYFDTSIELDQFSQATRLHENVLMNLIRAYKGKREKAKIESERTLEQLELLSTGPLRPYLELFAPFVQYRDSNEATMITNFAAASAVKDEVLLPGSQNDSSYNVLRNILLESILRHGGEIRHNVQITEAATARRRIELLHTNVSEKYAPKIVIDATQNKTFTGKITNGILRDKLALIDASVANNSQIVTLRWLLPRTSVPHALPPLSLIKPKTEQKQLGAVVGLYWPNIRTGVKSVLVVYSAMYGDISPSKAIEISNECLDELMPHARDTIIHHDVIAGPEAAASWPHYSFKGRNPNPFLGRSISGPISNLLRAGRDVAPTLGLQGEFATGMSVAAKAERYIKVEQNTRIFTVQNIFGSITKSYTARNQ